MVRNTMPSYVEIDTQHCGFVSCGRGNSLNDVYGSYSSAKAAAWNRCESICTELGGRNLCITSNNTYIFCAQFEFDNPDNGRPMVCDIKPGHVRAMYLDMRHIDTARDAWRTYTTMISDTSIMPDMRISDGVSVMWVGGVAYVIAYGEMYRIDNPWSKRKLRKRVVLHRAGC